MAEYCGGVCSIRPVNCGSSARIASAEGLRSLVLTTRPSVSSVSRSSPQAHREAIALAAVHHERDGLGGFADRDRQAAGGERIERAGVAGALGLEQPLHDRDRVGRGHADRLVEHDPAMDVALVAARLVVLARLLAARADRVIVRARCGVPKKYFFPRSSESPIGGSISAVAVVTIIRLLFVSNRVRGLSAPQVFAVISLFVPLRRIGRRRGSEDQEQILS